jgi:methylglutaconyl-CoA hydratase
VRIGVVPAVISITVLPRLLPRAAHELFLTGEVFDGTRAAAVGLVNSAVDSAGLDAEVSRYVDMLVLGAPGALAATKQVLRRVRPASMCEDNDAMLSLSAEHFAGDEGQEGIAAFAEKRQPSWVPQT